MKASTETQKQLVKLLVLEHGHQKAAELANVDYALVRQWSSRGKWKQKPDQSAPSQAVTNVANKLQNELQAYKARSTVALAKYSAEASEEATEAPKGRKLEISRKVKDVADIHRSIWPQEQNQSNILQIGFLVNQAAPELEQPKQVEGETIEDQPD